LMPDCTSGEFRDASDLTLTGLQQRLIDEVRATGTAVVVTLINGRALALTELAESIPSILEAWIPGEEGGAAIADVIFGSINPSGRLPLSLPRSVGQIPVNYDRRWRDSDYSDGPSAALYPFGHGLSYTAFEYAELDIQAAEDPTAPIEISLEIVNTGNRAGTETVQLYLGDPVASVTRPFQKLAGFAQVALDASQKRRVRFHLDPSQLAFYDQAMNFVIEPGQFDVRIGASSADIRLEGSFELGGPTHPVSARSIRPTLVTLD
jgi:beta-glucosidase